ncbi:MAG: YhfC family glutamic-type intramembrane protease [Actinomycetaceae bacterium]|nr:YhfC family glutamic-type intramembrane protease [Actinomycetaceae bacterium]
MVGNFTIATIVFSGLFGLIFPFLLLIYLRKTKRVEILPFFVGAGVMLVFAFILEGIFNFVVSRSAFGVVMKDHIWVLAIYGGLIAGLFEETGRFFAMKTALRKYLHRDENALSYGAGHGGFEAMVILGITALSNLFIAVAYNNGYLPQMLKDAPPEAAAELNQLVSQLIDTPAALFLVGVVERIFAIIMHLSLSVLVWFSVKNRKLLLFPLAILLHAVFNATSVVMLDYTNSVLITEVYIAVVALGTAFLASRVWKSQRRQNARL